MAGGIMGKRERWFLFSGFASLLHPCKVDIDQIIIQVPSAVFSS